MLLDEINRCFFRALRLQEPPYPATPEKFESALPDQQSINGFIGRLTDTGASVNLIYLDNTLTEDEVRRMMEESDYPFLIFTVKNGIAAPVFVSKEENERLVYSFEEGQPVRINLPEWEDLRTVLASRTDSTGEKGIPVVTCFPHHDIESTVERTSVTSASGRYNLIAKLITTFAPEKKEVLYILLYAVFIGIISLSLPLGVQSLIGFISSGQVVTSAVILIIFILLGIVLSGIMMIYQLELVEYLQQKLFARTAFAFAFRIPRLRLEAMLKYYPPELMNRFFDTLTIQKGVPVILIDLAAAILQVALGVILLSLYHPLFIIIGSILVITLVFILRLTGPRGLKTALQESEHKYSVVNWLEEMARSLSTFKLAGNTGFGINRMDHHVSNYIRAREDHFRVLKVQYYSFVFFKTIITAFLLVLGMVLIVKRQINLGQFVAAEIVIILIMNSIEKIIMKIDDVYDVLVGVEKISKVTGLPTDSATGIELPIEPGSGLSISIRNVSYRFPDRAESALNGFSLNISPSERICIAGNNGSGKSTLINLLLGLYDSYTGTITYNGISLRELNRPCLMNHIGNYVSQDRLFDGTVMENITIGRRNISNEDVFWAAEAAGVTEYINTLPEGFNTRLIGGGIRVPESVVHKLIMARNIVEHPSLLIVDDFLLGVEQSEKKRILDFLLDPKFKWTVILISNDPLVLTNCERIVFMKNGSVLEDGPFKQVLSRSEELKQLIYQHD